MTKSISVQPQDRLIAVVFDDLHVSSVRMVFAEIWKASMIDATIALLFVSGISVSKRFRYRCLHDCKSEQCPENDVHVKVHMQRSDDGNGPSFERSLA